MWYTTTHFVAERRSPPIQTMNDLRFALWSVECEPFRIGCLLVVEVGITTPKQGGLVSSQSTREAQIKSNSFNFCPKTNIHVIFTQGLGGGGVHQHEHIKLFKWPSALTFVFNFRNNIW